MWYYANTVACFFRQEERRLDDTDLRILGILRENSRINASVVADSIGMSISAVTERMKKLENSGIVKKYTLALDSKLVGMDVLAFISVSIEHPKYNDAFVAAIADNRHVMECHYITGDFDFMLKIMTASMDGLTDTLNTIKSIQGVSLTRTIVVLSTQKNEYCVIPEPAG